MTIEERKPRVWTCEYLYQDGWFIHAKDEHNRTTQPDENFQCVDKIDYDKQSEALRFAVETLRQIEVRSSHDCSNVGNEILAREALTKIEEVLGE